MILWRKVQLSIERLWLCKVLEATLRIQQQIILINIVQEERRVELVLLLFATACAWFLVQVREYLGGWYAVEVVGLVEARLEIVLVASWVEWLINIAWVVDTTH